MDSKTNARNFIQSLLDGEPTNGSTPTFDDLGAHAEAAQAIYSAFQADETAGARRAYEALAKNDKGLAELIAGDPPPAGPIFTRLSLAELLARPPKEWLIDGLIGKGDIAMLFGDPGSGKSLVTIDIIFAAALGRPFADRFTPQKPLKVAYCAGEGVAGLPGRFTAAVNKYRITPTDLDIDIFTDVPQLYAKEGAKTIETFITEFSDLFSDTGKQLDLLIIDTMHAATIGADENHAKDMGIVIEAVKKTRDKLGCTVLLVHHSNRAGNYRGSSAIHGALDTMLQTKGGIDGYGILECHKQKDTEKFNKIHFKITPEAYSQSVYVEWGETVTIDNLLPKKDIAKNRIVEILQEAPDGLNQTQLIELLEIGKNNIIEALKELEQDGQITYKTGPKNSKIYQLTLF